VRSSDPAALGAEILERSLDPVAAASSDAVAELIKIAEGRRPPLEEAASLLTARLHRRSDDFDATKALEAVTAALSQIGWEMLSPPTRHWRWTWG
jgi:hypothetical protein